MGEDTVEKCGTVRAATMKEELVFGGAKDTHPHKTSPQIKHQKKREPLGGDGQEMPCIPETVVKPDGRVRYIRTLLRFTIFLISFSSSQAFTFDSTFTSSRLTV